MSVSRTVSVLTNLALNQRSNMSSFDSIHNFAQLANDGDTRSDSSDCAHTATLDPAPYRWWRVDLGEIREIWYIDITNRGDCCGSYIYIYIIYSN